MTARSERPMRREISWVRPPILPLTDSRSPRGLVERGSMAYSAVTQPSPLPLRQRGTPSVTDAVQNTLVSPKETRTEPSACLLQPRSMLTGRSCSGVRPSIRDMATSLVAERERAPPGGEGPSSVRRSGRTGGSHHVFDLRGDGVGVGADDDLDRGAHLDDTVRARCLQSGLVHLGGVQDLGPQPRDAALHLFDVLDAAEPGNDLLSLAGHDVSSRTVGPTSRATAPCVPKDGVTASPSSVTGLHHLAGGRQLMSAETEISPARRRWQSAFQGLQKMGRSLQLPIAVLPAAGILNRLGQPDVFGDEGLGWTNVSKV